MPESVESSDPVRIDGTRSSARAGFVVSRTVGNAVTRNKVRRRLQHIVRSHLVDLPAGTDVVVRVLPPAVHRTYQQLDADLVQALSAARQRSRR